jgi:hypothetical protein
LSLPELTFILDKQREKDNLNRRFQAAVAGVDLGPDESSESEQLKEIKRRAAERIAGGTAAVEKSELAEFGIGFESI